MPALERRLGLRGPRFYGEGDGLMFVNYLDSSTRDGPRAATEADTLEHPAAWALFCAEVDAEEAGMGEGAVHPFRAMVTFVDPPEGAPPREVGPHAKARASAKAEGREA